jgi:hypothetical protein
MLRLTRSRERRLGLLIRSKRKLSNLGQLHDLDCPSLRTKGLDRERGLAFRAEEAMLAIIVLSSIPLPVVRAPNDLRARKERGGLPSPSAYFSFVVAPGNSSSLSTLNAPGVEFACIDAMFASLSRSTTPVSVTWPLFTMMWIA